MKKIIAIIPAHNEENTVEKVIIPLQKFTDQIIVVDDRSEDKTAKIAKKRGAIVISNVSKLGPSKSLDIGIRKAIKLNPDILVTIDADGQHPVNIVPNFIKLITKQKFDVVVGCRKELPRITEVLFSYYSTKKIGVKDPINGLKAFKKEVILKIGYFDKLDSMTSEILFESYINKFKIYNYPIEVYERKDKPRLGGVLLSNIKMLIALLKVFKKYTLKI
tara:strand:- start:392 stop:1048 length:657 start_codon:yes stop_codon:yes gene_type:complete